ncbi:nodulation protein NfeD [Paenibacillus sp. TRM 82003]|nr:nodulation protein NfeD [Paenibacillus sp. TRM 82003]
MNIIFKRLFGWLAVCGLTLAAFGGAWTTAQAESQAPASGTVLIHVDRTIETGLESYLKRALEEAEASGAAQAVLVIDTFGGRVDAAEGIGQAIRGSKLQTIAYVKGKAISAGSYIALNADQIYMETGSSIGAAAVVTVGGERVTDSKIVSAWVGLMSGAAEANGRDPEIAAGMVDETIAFEKKEFGYSKAKGTIITLSAEKAVQVGYAEGVVPSLEAFLTTIGAAETVTIEPTPAEQLARFLTNPATQTVLMILGLAGILIELLVPGFGVPGIIGVTSFGLYFLGNYVAGFAGVEHVALFVVGVVLLLLELFIPSFGILGVLGIASLISGVVLAAYDTGNAFASLGIAVLVAGVIVAIFIRYFKHRGIWNKFILRDSLRTEEGYVSYDDRSALIGERGLAVTPLRPSGTMEVNGKRIDVVTRGEFISSGAEVVVTEIEGVRVVVKETIQ